MNNQFKCGFLSGGIWIGPGAKSVTPCCHITKSSNSMKHENFDSLINHPTLVAMRKQSIKGQIPDGCIGCVNKESNGLFSPRMKANIVFSNKGVVKEYIDYSDVEQVYVSLSNICNYKCVMCSSGQSHLIAKEYKEKNPLLMVSDDKFEDFIDLIKKSKNLKNIQVTGGEPFQHKTRLRKLLTNLPKNVYFYMHTNGSFFDKETEELCKMMENFKEASVNFSIDGHKNSFEYQRTNGVWNDVLQNVINFNKSIDTDKVNCNLSYTVSCFNLLDVLDCIKNYNHLFNQLDFFTINQPSEYVIGMLKQDILEKTYDEFISWQATADPNLKRKIYIDDIVVNLKNTIDNPVDQNTIKDFWHKTEYMRDIRGIDLETKMPELIYMLRSMDEN